MRPGHETLTSGDAPRRSVLSFTDRGGRLTAGQQRAWDRLWPRYGALAPGFDRAGAGPTPPVRDGRLDAPAWFGREAPVRLEIGSGMGETTAALALAEPDADHVAVEVYPPGLGQLLMRIEEHGITNLRLLRGDAVVVLEELIAPDSLAGLRVYYPDPWPKRRHHKRRLVQPATVALMASRLAPGATLHLATDVADYAEQMREVTDAEPLLTNPHGGFAPRPAWRPRTKFESRAEQEGRPSRDLLLVRTGPEGSAP
ncbi:tRNA (guanosine(46)-N7)-methyltransferase TrmB [Actinomycetospora lemnae]|uniref:tRNA (guanine-N(7)-)-methyltransferase n=1 Tax=Actinomycetospora lemnae TaxID=3019891 RepID=A0ABT5SS54_9PSEU|nr:tRNA (guanosine(46)-N7)-methyltransferase TrmB [Actinomycetospora sp. DW7H6]MDD7965619.1 tRNA (guanosine(46)-N7)-methyltransferase TrmB [Actinomycetospora sp. DW7H6]